MNPAGQTSELDEMKNRHPEKFVPEEEMFGNVHAGDRIFISTGCGEPQYLVKALTEYIRLHPEAFYDTEIFQVWSLGVAPYADEKFKNHFRHNSFFIGDHTRDAVNACLADYTPVFLSNIPDLFYRGHVPVDVALIQTSPPDSHGHMSLGVSVDIVKAAVEKASLVFAQVNKHMPRVHGDGFINIADVDHVVLHDEPVMVYTGAVNTDVAQNIGNHVSRLVQDGATIQVGYGSIPNAIMSNLRDKKHLGIHTELLSDGIADLMKEGVIDNTKKTINRGKTVATFCMGNKSTYDFIHDNPAVEFRTIDYTNNPLIIAQHDNMTAINSALAIDFTGQATAESIGKTFYSGIGGQADFMRGAVFARHGRTILTLQSTAETHQGPVSRIVPFLPEGSGVTLNRGDVHYVVTEYGVAYLHGKNIRERAIQLISIAHPKFRSQLIKEAKRLNLIYRDQAFIPGKSGEYPEDLETYRTTSKGHKILLRPVKISDDSLLKDFFYSLSDTTRYRRFLSREKSVPRNKLQQFSVINYAKEVVILAVLREREKEIIAGIGQYYIIENLHYGEVKLVVRDDYQRKGIGQEILDYLIYLAKKQGLLGFSAEALVINEPIIRLLEKSGFESVEKRVIGDIYKLKLIF